MLMVYITRNACYANYILLLQVYQYKVHNIRTYNMYVVCVYIGNFVCKLIAIYGAYIYIYIYIYVCMYMHMYINVCMHIRIYTDSVSRRAVVSSEAKKKQHARAFQAYATTTVSYLHGWSSKILKCCSSATIIAIT